MSAGDGRKRPLVSVVIPALDEAEVLPELHARLDALRRREGIVFDMELIFVDDGSTDGTGAVLAGLAEGDPRVRVVTLGRNLGQEAACAAGLDLAAGDAVVVMDADLQDPPEAIPALVDRWLAGCDVVHARRRSRRGEPAAKRAAAWIFYRLMNVWSDVPLVTDAGNFRLMDGAIVEALRRSENRGRFLRGLACREGRRQEVVEFDREPPAAGRSKYDLGRQARLALGAAIALRRRGRDRDGKW
jgi:dolichol-phosphate mannosyltransferase